MTQHTVDNNSTTPIYCSNAQFLAGIFGVQANKAHVTVFHDDPNNINTPEARAKAWAGGHWGNKQGYFQHGGNQYFTISLFKPADDGRDRRRKSLFEACYAVVVDDVGTGLSAKVDPNDRRLPLPSYKLETSPGNEQWGYILSFPEMDRHRVENLLDGMVEANLVPDGTDPGMKGVTRYVRLPEGTNNKQKYVEVLGAPFQCLLTHWDPVLKYSIDALAECFGIDLNVERQDKEGLHVDDETHPGLVAYAAQFGVKSKLEQGRYDVTCPNLAYHTDMDDSGTAIWTYPDGRLGFKCHHGHCEELSGNWIMNQLYAGDPDLKMREVIYGGGFTANPDAPEIPQPQVFSDSVPAQPVPHIIIPDANAVAFCKNNDNSLDIVADMQTYLQMCSLAASCHIPETRTVCIQHIAHNFNQPIGDVRRRVNEFTPAIDVAIDPAIVSRYLHIKTMHKFLDRQNFTIIAPEALNQSWNSGDEQAQVAFKDAGGHSVDELTWQPCSYGGQAQEIISKGSLVQANTYQKPDDVPDLFDGVDVSPYIKHTEFLIPDPDERKAVLDHMAFTMQHPEIKIQWQILLFGMQGTGKDTLLLPLADYFKSMYRDVKAADDNANQWGDTFFKKKVLVYQEVFRPRDKKFSNELKTLASSTAGGRDELNIKGKGQVSQPNMYSMYMFSNHEDPLHIEEGDRRIFPVGDHDIKQPAEAYFTLLYDWLDDRGGRLAVVRWLLTRDVSRAQFNPNRLPFHTKARGEIIDHSRSESRLAIEEELVLRRGVFAATISCFTSKMLGKILNNRGERFANTSAISQELGKMGIQKLDRTRVNNSDIRLWVNPCYTGHDVDGAIQMEDLTTHGGRIDAYRRCGLMVG